MVIKLLELNIERTVRVVVIFATFNTISAISWK